MRIIAVILTVIIIKELARLHKGIKQLQNDNEVISKSLCMQKDKQTQFDKVQRTFERDYNKYTERAQRELEKLAREQQKQAEQLAKHEKRISDIEFKLTQAESDIEHWREQINNLYALMDIEQGAQAEALPGSKADIQSQKRIITLSNRIHTAESRLAKAKHNKAAAEKELAA